MALQPRSACFLVQFLRTFGGGGFYAKSVGFWGSAPDPNGGASNAFSKRTNGEFSTTIQIDQVFGILSRWFIGALNMHIHVG